MSFVDDYTLTRSSVFKTLIGLFLVIAIINIMVVRQVYIDSDSFHREQLTKQLNDEIMEFSYLAEQSREEVEKLLQAKKASNTPFYYRLIEHIEPTYSTQFYPISSLPNDTTNIAIGDNVKLEIGVNPQVVEAYRNALVPIVLSSIVLPIAVMLVAALFFTILILRRLENVNKAMNRVLCGERDVKLEVSQQDDEFDILAIHL
ncbi:two-component sensor histidine kinase, partial [Vibrio sinaloensis]